MTTIAYRTCHLCEATCGLELHLEDDAISLVRGDRDDVFTHGYLCPKGTAIKQETTKADGTFEFKDLPPGTYTVYYEKVSTRRRVLEPVEVKPGETTKKEFALLIP